MLHRRYHKMFNTLIIFLIVLSLLFWYNISYFGNIKHIFNTSLKLEISCYFKDQHSNSLLELNPNEVTKNSIFFFETSCNHENGINLNLRQACAIESAANLNPNVKIFVLFVAPIIIHNKSDVIDVLKKYSNINLRHINFVKYSRNTPLQYFVASNTIFTSNWPVSHTSDLLRYLTLWKFGGTYLDLDIVLMKSLENITNFASIESNKSIASFVLNFDVDNIGKTIANIAINDFANNYLGNDWGYNGPGVITRTLKTFCNTNIITEMNKQRCNGFTLFEPESFCPISWPDWKLYFDSNSNEKVMAKLRNSMGIHVWNLHSKNTFVEVGSKQPYGLVAQHFCPASFSLAKNVF